MKILFQSFEIADLLKDSDNIAGGAAVEWYSWIKGLQKTKEEFALLSYAGTKKFIGKELDFEIIESFNLNKGIPKLRFFYYRLPSLYKVIKKYKPDIIITENATVYVGILALISKLLKIPFVFRVANDTDVDDRLKSTVNTFDYYMYKFGLNLTKYFIAQNSYQSKKIKEWFPKSNVIVLHNPFFSELPYELVEKSTREYIAWVGNFRYQKNLAQLLNVVESLPNEKFKIAGQAHINLDEETKTSVEELKKHSNVEFVGYLKRSEIFDFFLNAKMLLNTSRWEGFSNTFLEAWGSGVPIVTTTNVNPDNLIPKYNLGLVAENNEELPETVNQLLNSENYNDYKSVCYNYVNKYHSPEILADKMVSFFKEILQTR